MANGTTYTAAQMEAKMTPEDQGALRAAKEGWGAAYAAGDEAGMAANAKAAEDVRAKYYYSGGEDGSQVIFFNDGKMPDGLVLNSGGSGTGKTGNNSRSQDTVDELKGLYGDSSAYARALAQQQAANDKAVKQTVSELQAQKTQTNQSYADTFRQLYIQKKNAQKNLGQRLAAQGINGGASESSMLDLETGYSEALRQGEQARINAQGELDRAISQAKLTGEVENARIVADGVREQTAGYASVLQSLLNRQDSWDMHNESMEYQRGRDKVSNEWKEKEWEHKLETEGDNETIVARDDARSRIDTFLQAGGTVDALYAALGEELIVKSGLTRGELEQIAAYYKNQNTPKASYSGGGGYKPTLTAAQTLAALNDGVVNEATLKAYKYYYGQDWVPKYEDDGTWSGVQRRSDREGYHTWYEWNGKAYPTVESLIDAFNDSEPSGYAYEQMKKYLESIGVRYDEI